MLTSPISNQFVSLNHHFKLSEAILKNPKSLTDNNTKLSLVEKSIYEIDDLQSQKLQALEVLYLSNNHIKDLANLAHQFPNLKSLSLSFNNIRSLQEIQKLQGLLKLESLRVEGNEINAATYPNFRKIVIYMLPQLKNLDGEDVSEKERSQAEIVYQKQQGLIQMIYENQIQKSVLEAIINKIKLHQHMNGLGQVLDNRKPIDYEYILRFSKREFSEIEMNSWFERHQIKSHAQLFDTFSKKSDQNWDLKFSELIVSQQSEIAQLKLQIKNPVQRPRHRASNSSTPRVISNLNNSLFGIQSPKIIETDRSKSQVNANFITQQTSSTLQASNMPAQKPASNKKKQATGTNSKKKKKKLSNTTPGLSKDIRQMNLSRVFDIQTNPNDINLLDNTFNGLLLNEESENIDPSVLQPHVLSPNTIINNRVPEPKRQEKVNVQQVQSAQILEKLESLENQVQARTQENQTLTQKNKQLVAKIKEFKLQNDQNVEQARQQIQDLQKHVKETQEERLLAMREQEFIQEHVKFLEDENRVLSVRLQEIEEAHYKMQNYHQEMNDELYEQGKLQIADNLREFVLKRYYFPYFRMRVQRQREIRLFYHRRQQKQSLFLKTLSFLYLRQNLALSKHLKHLATQKYLNLQFQALTALYQNKIVQQKLRMILKKRGQKLKRKGFKSFLIYKKLSYEAKREELNTQRIRELLLKNKGYKALKRLWKISNLPFNPINEAKAINQRKRTMIRAMIRVIFIQLPKERIKMIKAENKYKKHLTLICFQKVFKGIMQRKKLFKAKIKHCRFQQVQKLKIKAFSALLFEKFQRQDIIKPLHEKQLQFTKLRYMRKWVKEFKKSRTLASKLRFFYLRWMVLKKKFVLQHLERATLKLHRLNKTYSKVTQIRKLRVCQKHLDIWMEQYDKIRLEKRLLKFKAMKALKINLRFSKKLNMKAYRFYLRSSKKFMKKILQEISVYSKQKRIEKQKIESFRQNHVERVLKTFFYRMISQSFISCSQRQREEITVLQVISLFDDDAAQEKLEPLQNTFEEKQQELKSKSQFTNLAFNDQIQISQMQVQIEQQLKCLKESDQMNKTLESKIKELQEQQLKRLEEYKDKFMQSNSEIQRLKELLSKDKEKSKEEEKNNIKLLHQLKKSYKTIDEMTKALEQAESQVISQVDNSLDSEIKKGLRSNKERNQY